jgi:hypothetical protein
MERPRTVKDVEQEAAARTPLEQARYLLERTYVNAQSSDWAQALRRLLDYCEEKQREEDEQAMVPNVKPDHPEHHREEALEFIEMDAPQIDEFRALVDALENPSYETNVPLSKIGEVIPKLRLRVLFEKTDERYKGWGIVTYADPVKLQSGQVVIFPTWEYVTWLEEKLIALGEYPAKSYGE